MDDLKLFLSEVKNNKKYAPIDRMELRVKQYSDKGKDYTVYAYRKGVFTYKSIKRKNLEKMNAENIDSYFKFQWMD